MELPSLSRRDFIKGSALVTSLLAGCGSGNHPRQGATGQGGLNTRNSPGTTHQVTVQMSSATLAALDANRYNLYAFQAVQASTQSGEPVVWFTLPALQLSESTSLSWSNDFQTYTSESAIVNGTLIYPGSTATIAIGQTANVSANGLMNVSSDGTPSAISFFDTFEGGPFTFGIQQNCPDQSYATVCALEMFYDYVYLIQPIDQVMLMMSSVSVPPGTVLRKSSGPGILINLSGQTARTVNYDINQGWTWGNEIWSQAIDGNTDLSPILVQYSTLLAHRAKNIRSALL